MSDLPLFTRIADERIAALESQRTAERERVAEVIDLLRDARGLLDHATHHDGRYEQCASRGFQKAAIEVSSRISSVLVTASLQATAQESKP